MRRTFLLAKYRYDWNFETSEMYNEGGSESSVIGVTTLLIANTHMCLL